MVILWYAVSLFIPETYFFQWLVENWYYLASLCIETYFSELNVMFDSVFLQLQF